MQFKNTSQIDMTLRGVDFPSGKVVTVENAELAKKLDAMPEFDAVETKRKTNAKKRR